MNPNKSNTPRTSADGQPRVNIANVYPSELNVSHSDSPKVHSPHQVTAHQPPPLDSVKKNRDGIKSVLSTIALFLLAPIIALSLTAFAFQSYQVDGQSMETTLQNQDRLIVNKIPRTISRITGNPYIPKRGDIVVFNGGGLFDGGPIQDKQLIKRVIGLPGEDVELKNGKLTIYNKDKLTGFDPDRSGIYNLSSKTTPGDVDRRTLGPNEIFVCGDNRANSEDSRYFGPIDSTRIVGELVFRIYPFSKVDKF